MTTAVYDRIGKSYAAVRQTEPRMARVIWQALGDAQSVVNVGAGTGSYEPTDREVLAVEPSPVMIAQRTPGSAPAIRASAEHLPLPDKSYDAALAINTLHHWNDVQAGLRELRRVTRRRIVIVTRDARLAQPFWLMQRYFPALDHSQRGIEIVDLMRSELGELHAIQLPVPRDCRDGLLSAHWACPERYLDETVRSSISNFALADPDVVARGVERLRADLESGAWDREYGELRTRPDFDFGLRVFVREL